MLIFPPPDDPYYENLLGQLEATKTKPQLFDAIVNAPFRDKVHATMIDLGIIVLLLVDPKKKTIDRIALSKTEPAEGAERMSIKPFHHIKIPLGHPDNSIAKAIASGKLQKTEDWHDLFVPALGPEAARFNQAGAGIESSFVMPLSGPDLQGALIFSFYQPLQNIGAEHQAFIKFYTEAIVKNFNRLG